MRQIDGILNNLRTLTNAKTDKEMCKILEIPYGTFDIWKTRDSIPAKRLFEFSKKLNVSIEQLTGDASVDNAINSIKNALNPVKDTMNKLSNAAKLPNLKPNLHTQTKLNFYNMEVSAGYGVSDDDYEVVSIDAGRDVLGAIFAIPQYKELDMLKVRGDSMEPFVKDGEHVMINRNSEAKNGDVVIAVIDGDRYIKKLLKIPNKGVRLTSLNDYYPDIELLGDEVDRLKIIGVVVAKYDLNLKLF
ncbi:S24 family peptidase [Campylobacter fetus]|uniref:LexA family transcriptional regulator n=1 Tax=Campylobacter fetus TaxID=196 RepID=UPI00073A9D6A|nr:S24 family peptidase [Campylobacter fetus]ALV64635.1 putative peptidase S24 LexA-like protein [Campylobacter fetus subsp. testudinum Sp3]